MEEAGREGTGSPCEPNMFFFPPHLCRCIRVPDDLFCRTYRRTQKILVKVDDKMIEMQTPRDETTK